MKSRQLKDGEHITLDEYTGLSVYTVLDGLALRVLNCYSVGRSGDTIIVIIQKVNEDGTEASDSQHKASLYDKQIHGVADVLLEYDDKVRESGAEVMVGVPDETH